ncbi:MAG: c-type cytochrome biogenesis protein CcmI [Hyphomicrobium sp.]|nr:c-type cytochrome biogenesis protein CcmI [Hyphomicrobium sp.]
MLLWVIFSILTAGVVGALLWSYRRADEAAAGSGHADVAVYADQLLQIDADRARGLLSEAEAQSARAEVGRRMLTRAADVDTGVATATRGSERVLGVVALSIPVLALILYTQLGSPGLPDLPHAGRTAEDAARSQVDAMIARVEQRLRSAPEDGNGWDVIGPVYLRMERYGQAAEAFANANRLLGETPKRLAGFVQAEILANNGIVNSNAKMAAERLLALEPDRLDARMWLALAKEQDGQFAEALTDYRALIKAPQMTPAMTSAIEVRISAVERLARGETVEPPASGGMSGSTGPGGEMPSDAAGQQAMIEGMVARLAGRLAADGKDPAGWAQLMRSYMVLGRKDDATKALSDARRALGDDAAALEQVNTAAAELGVEGAAKEEKK